VESVNGLYEWELIYPRGPWQGLSDVEFATLEYVDWFNHRRLHGQITYGPGYHPGRLRGRLLPLPHGPNRPGRDRNPRVSMKPRRFRPPPAPQPTSSTSASDPGFDDPRTP
jgi:hypothetical protein